MNSEIIPIDQGSDFSERAKTVAGNVKAKANDKLETIEQKVRQSPTKAVLIAFGAGYCLNRLPAGSLLAIPLRLTAVLAKPALLILGGMKFYDIIDKQSRK